MYLTLLATAILTFGGNWRIDNLEIYRPIVRNHFAASEAGFFVLHFKDQMIAKHDRHGARIGVIVRRGPGPRELSQANAVFFQDGRLFVATLYKIKWFDRDGGFIREIRRPDPFLSMEKAPGRWLAYPNPLSSPEKDRLLLYNEDLSAKNLLDAWETEAIRGRGMPLRPDRFALWRSWDGERLYLRKPFSTMVDVWSLTEEKVIRRIALDIRIDAMHSLKAYLEHRREIGERGIQTNAWYPRMLEAPNGDLYFYPAGYLDKALVFDATGRQKQARFSQAQLESVIAVADGHCYQSVMDPKTEEFYIARRPIENFGASRTN